MPQELNWWSFLSCQTTSCFHNSQEKLPTVAEGTSSNDVGLLVRTTLQQKNSDTQQRNTNQAFTPTHSLGNVIMDVN